MKYTVPIFLVYLAFFEAQGAILRQDCDFTALFKSGIDWTHELTDSTLPDFKNCDTDKDYSLSWDETSKCPELTSHGIPTEDSFNLVDDSGDGSVDLTELLDSIIDNITGFLPSTCNGALASGIGLGQTIINDNLPSFKTCDTDNNYELTTEETAGCNMFATSGVSSAGFNDTDADGNGSVSFNELLSVIFENILNGKK